MLWSVIMAGGSGTRFWPESREKTPKQFLKIFGSKTLLGDTIDRLTKIIPRSRMVVVTQKADVARVQKLTKIPAAQIIGEPVGRNTAPCMALAASVILKKDPDAVIAILPSDHRIEKVPVFQKALICAADVAAETKLPVTFGIRPTSPHTGYGYLEIAELSHHQKGFEVHRLKAFHEKPSLERAEDFVRSGRFLWNSGMFVWHADSLLEAVSLLQPAMLRLAKKIVSPSMSFPRKRESKLDPRLEHSGMTRRMNQLYSKMPSTSIDYGLMEKLRDNILTIPVDIGWNDLGSWQSFAELIKPDREGNVIQGKAILVESSSNIVRSSKRLIAMVGTKDLVVVDTEDAILICPKDQTEFVRKIVSRLKEKNWKKYL